MPITPQAFNSLSETALRYERMTLSGLYTGYLLAQIIRSPNLSDEISRSMTALNGHLARHNLTPENYFSGMLLIHAVSEVENYLVDVLKTIITQHPKKLGDVEFKLADIVDKERGELVLMAADILLNRLMYLRPKEYLKEFCHLVSIDISLLEAHWPSFIEAKARRDLGIHNSWKRNSTYVRRLVEAGITNNEIPVADEHGFLFANFDYMDQAISSCDSVVRVIRDALEQKFAPNTHVGV
jgi:hypothetical protein